MPIPVSMSISAVSMLSVLTEMPLVTDPIQANILPPTFQASWPPPQGSDFSAPGKGAQMAWTSSRNVIRASYTTFGNKANACKLRFAGDFSKSRPMSVEVIIEDARWEESSLEAHAQTAVAAALSHLNLGEMEVSILACDDARIAVLNSNFRDKPAPTNVLSWPSEERAPKRAGEHPDPPEKNMELGDLALAFETCQREAAEQGKSFDQHILHLIVHGVLHLLGYDHVREGDGDLMESVEIAILARLGVPDPY